MSRHQPGRETDLSLPVEIVGCPIVREDDGLAMSSRNVKLTPEQRAAATVLHRALLAGRNAADPEAAMAAVVATEPLADLDYVGDVFSFVSRSLLERSPSFAQGESLAAGAIAPHPALFRVGRRLTAEGGGDVGSGWSARRA